MLAGFMGHEFAKSTVGMSYFGSYMVGASTMMTDRQTQTVGASRSASKIAFLAHVLHFGRDG